LSFRELCHGHILSHLSRKKLAEVAKKLGRSSQWVQWEYFNNYAVGKDAGVFRLTQSSEIPNPAEAVSRLMPIEGYKARWGNARRWGYAKTAPTSKRPMIHVSQRNARSHGSVTRGLVFQRRAMTASIPIVTNGSTAEIANSPSNMSFASGLIIHHFTPR